MQQQQKYPKHTHTRGIELISVLKCFYSLGGSNMEVQPASFSAAIKVSLPSQACDVRAAELQSVILFEDYSIFTAV